MGSGASTAGAASGIEIISPRIEMTKKGPKNSVLDSVPLSDVGSGTIHYRYKTPEVSVHDTPHRDESKIPTGYFFHPKLQDYSELGDPTHEEAYKFIRVASGPKRSQNQDVFYVSGIGFNGTNNDIPPTLLKETGKRAYGHKYFNISSEKIDDDLVDFNEGIFVASEKEVVLKILSLCTVKDVRRKLGNHYLCPLAIIHVSNEDGDLSDNKVLKEIFSGDMDEDESDNNELILRLIMQPN